MRIDHYIKTNDNSESPTNLLFIDTEAKIDGEKQTFRLGYAIHFIKLNGADGDWTRTDYKLYTLEDCWNLFDKLNYDKKRLYVIAHNMAYDYTTLMVDSYASSRDKIITMRVVGSSFIIKFAGFVFLDSMNYYKTSLAELGKIVGLAKMESPDFIRAGDAELMVYCARDVEVLAKVMLRYIEFLKDNDLGCFKMTIAAQAFQTFRHKFLKEKILVHTRPDILAVEKASYRGGRTEVFHLGKHQDVYYLDINSMYPYVMRTFEYPIVPIPYSPLENVDIPKLKEIFAAGKYVVAECELDMKEPFIPCDEKKLIFPIGKFVQTIQTPEILYLLAHPECGKIVRIRKLVSYDSANIFREYVDFFYGLRLKASNEADKTVCKLLLNSLYGKFGQRCHPEIVTVLDEIRRNSVLDIMSDDDSCELLDLNTGGKYVKLGDKLYYSGREKGDYGFESVPIIASAVTAYARRLLFQLMKIAGLDNILYCDTDSLFVTKEGYDNLLVNECIHPTELGKMKVEKVGNCEIKGVKDYVFNGEVKIKGIKKDAEKLGEGVYRQKQFETKNIRYRKGTPDGIVIVKDVTKTLTRTYDKGIVHPDGKVTPFVLKEW